MAGTTIPQARLPSISDYLTDPVSKTLQRGRISQAWYQWTVMVDAAVRTTAAASVTDFTDLADAPGTYTGFAGQMVTVNVGETGLQFTAPLSRFTQLSDVPNAYSGADLKSVRVNAAANALEFGPRFASFSTVAGLPASAAAGDRGFVTDSTVAASGNFGVAVAGSGSNKAPVYYDGVAWRIG